LVAGHGFGCTSTFNAGDLSLVPQWPPLALQYGSAVCRLPLVRGMDDSGAADEPRGCFPRPHEQPDRSITVQYKTMESQLLLQKKRGEGRRREKAFSALAFQRRFCLPPPEPICMRLLAAVCLCTAPELWPQHAFHDPHLRSRRPLSESLGASFFQHSPLYPPFQS